MDGPLSISFYQIVLFNLELISSKYSKSSHSVNDDNDPKFSYCMESKIGQLGESIYIIHILLHTNLSFQSKF